MPVTINEYRVRRQADGTIDDIRVRLQTSENQFRIYHVPDPLLSAVEADPRQLVALLASVVRDHERAVPAPSTDTLELRDAAALNALVRAEIKG